MKNVLVSLWVATAVSPGLGCGLFESDVDVEDDTQGDGDPDGDPDSASDGTAADTSGPSDTSDPADLVDDTRDASDDTTVPIDVKPATEPVDRALDALAALSSVPSAVLSLSIFRKRLTTLSPP